MALPNIYFHLKTNSTSWMYISLPKTCFISRNAYISVSGAIRGGCGTTDIYREHSCMYHASILHTYDTCSLLYTVFLLWETMSDQTISELDSGHVNRIHVSYSRADNINIVIYESLRVLCLMCSCGRRQVYPGILMGFKQIL